jgi:putative hydrolase of the HAD superfamily
MQAGNRGVTIRAVLFDFGGVLADEGFRNGLIALAREQNLDPDAMVRDGMHAVYDSGFVLGKGTAADFWAMLRERTGLAGGDSALTDRILAGFAIRPWMIELVRGLRRDGLVPGILSDQTHWLDALDARSHFFEAFDHVYNSFHLGKGKRDATLFSDVASDLGLAPAAILFVDDDAGNVARAQAMGLQTIRFLNRPDFESRLQAKLGRRVVSG